MRIAIPTKLNQKLAEVTGRRTLPQGILGRATEWRELLNLLILPRSQPVATAGVSPTGRYDRPLILY